MTPKPPGRAHPPADDDPTEKLFPCGDLHRDEYARRVEAGRVRAGEATVSICALARSLGDGLPLAIERIERIGRMFGDYRVVVYENDSDDSTARRLREWAESDGRVRVKCERLGVRRFEPTRCAERMAWMAFYREQCRRFAMEQGALGELVIVLDSDLRGGWSGNGLLNTLGHDGWDAVGSNGLFLEPVDHGPYADTIVSYFDVWAFRSLGHPEPHEAEEINPLVLPRGHPMVRVLSCFGGLAIYRRDAWRSGRYAGGDCEHATFHAALRERGFDRIFLNPSQVALYDDLGAGRLAGLAT